MSNPVSEHETRCKSSSLNERNACSVGARERCGQCRQRFNSIETYNEEGDIIAAPDLNSNATQIAYICATTDPDKEDPGCMGLFCSACTFRTLNGSPPGHRQREDTPSPPTQDKLPSFTKVSRRRPHFCSLKVEPSVSWEKDFKPEPEHRRSPIRIDDSASDWKLKPEYARCSFVGCCRSILVVAENLKLREDVDPSEIDAYMRDVAQCPDENCKALYCFDCYDTLIWKRLYDDRRARDLPESESEKIFSIHYHGDNVQTELNRLKFSEIQKLIKERNEKRKSRLEEKRKRESSTESEEASADKSRKRSKQKAVESDEEESEDVVE